MFRRIAAFKCVNNANKYRNYVTIYPAMGCTFTTQNYITAMPVLQWLCEGENIFIRNMQFIKQSFRNEQSD
jgi:hypothetical protein